MKLGSKSAKAVTNCSTALASAKKAVINLEIKKIVHNLLKNGHNNLVSTLKQCEHRAGKSASVFAESEEKNEKTFINRVVDGIYGIRGCWMWQQK